MRNKRLSVQEWQDILGRQKQTNQNDTEWAPQSFNKSHAVAYTVIAYETAYLKANYPDEFMATKSDSGE